MRGLFNMKYFLILMTTVTSLMAQRNGTYPASSSSGGSSANVAPFVLPFTQAQLAFPTNFMLTNPALTNQVIIVQVNGNIIVYSNTANTDVGRGQTFLNAEEDSHLAAGDVFFLSAGRYAMNFNTLTNQGLAVTPIDMTSDGGNQHGSHLVGAGKNLTLLDLTGSGSANATLGTYTSLRDISITNSQGFTDGGSSSDLFATNQFAYFINVGYTNQLVGAQDVWSQQNSTHQNLWVQNCSFSFEYDVFANSGVPITNTLVCYNNIWYNNGNNIYPITRLQYGTMARTCYVDGDIIYTLGGTNFNIGIDNSDTSKTNSTMYVWNTSVTCLGPGQRSVWNGTFTNNKIFLGAGNVYDASSAYPNFINYLSNISVSGLGINGTSFYIFGSSVNGDELVVTNSAKNSWGGFTAQADNGNNSVPTNYFGLYENNSAYVPGTSSIGSTNDGVLEMSGGNEYDRLIGMNRHKYFVTSASYTSGNVTNIDFNNTNINFNVPILNHSNPVFQNTNVQFSAGTTFTWQFQNAYTDTNYSVSMTGAGATMAAPVVGAKTTTSVVLSMTAFTGTAQFLAIHQ